MVREERRGERRGKWRQAPDARNCSRSKLRICTEAWSTEEGS